MGNATTTEMQASLTAVRRSPSEEGQLELIVCRPLAGERAILDEAVLDPGLGLVGDSWWARPSRQTPDGGPHPDMQLTLVNTRWVRAIAGDGVERRALVGDQLHVDLDVSEANLPPGSRLAIAGAVVEITAEPHTGCQKFTERFGLDATRFVNSPAGRALRLRGVNARILAGGTIRRGDAVQVVRAP